MKKRLICILVLLSALLCCSCSRVRIPNSAEAKERLTNLGYSVDVTYYASEKAAIHEVEQLTMLYAKKGDAFIQVYFFKNPEDTKIFYDDNSSAICKNAEVISKNRYSIYRGHESAVNDFLIQE